MKFSTRQYTPKRFEVTFPERPGWTWTIEQPSADDLIEMERYEQDSHNSFDIMIHEILATFAGTNIRGSDGFLVLYRGDNVLFAEDVLRSMPKDMLLGIWTKIGELVPGWGPVKECE